AWSPDRMRSLPRLEPLARAPRPVFIVGILRSGSSLLEQILDAHPQIRGMGEWPVLQEGIRQIIGRGELPRPADLPALLNLDLLQRLRAFVLEAATPRCGDGIACFTDKQLGNVHWVGLISLLFPDAPVITCTRDHLDTCISAWFQDLPNLYTHRLDDMARYCLTIERLTTYWQSALANPQHTVPYEAMATGQEESTRAVLDVLGLPWDSACLRFHENRRVTLTVSNQQVNRPMYTSSVGRHQNYDRHLGDLRRVLATPGP
ncbi:MAG: sulfotransferase, partial [Phycisphaerales bacterium]|nr:sulfotransferase [Phycisphaerales bacterium]